MLQYRFYKNQEKVCYKILNKSNLLLWRLIRELEFVDLCGSNDISANSTADSESTVSTYLLITMIVEMTVI